MAETISSLNSAYNKKEEVFDLLSVIRLGFEPKTPTLKVLCSTS